MPALGIENMSEWIKTLFNQNEKKISVEDFLVEAKLFKDVWIDIGAGDCKFLYSIAKSQPNTFCIAVDANEEGMREISRKVERKPAKGGLPSKNLIFVVSSIEEFPTSIKEIADQVTINYPWGSLLKGLLEPSPLILQKISSLAKSSSEILILLNYSMFDDHTYIKKLGLPNLTPSYVDQVLIPEYAKFRLQIVKHAVLSKEETTYWGKKLAHEGRGKTYEIVCKPV